MKKILIINVYFGKYPNYFYLWLKSAEANKTIDFLLVTDQKLDHLPENVKILPMTLDEFSIRASEKLELNINLKSPYKCCDFKVAYGLIFQEEISGYDFWGHCDIDLIWGDLRKFITDDILDKYEKIYPLGHLALFRNSEKMNRAFMLEGSRKGDYKTIFTSDEHFAFDELRGMYCILKQNCIPQYEEYDFADISPVFKRFKTVRSYTDHANNYSRQIFVYENGAVVRYFIKGNEINKDEFSYIHLQKRRFSDSAVSVDPLRPFVISPEGFKNIYTTEVAKSQIRRYNRYYGRLYEWLEIKKRNLKYRRAVNK